MDVRLPHQHAVGFGGALRSGDRGCGFILLQDILIVQYEVKYESRLKYKIHDIATNCFFVIYVLKAKSRVQK